MRNFVLCSVVALWLIQLVTHQCEATRRGSGSGRGSRSGFGSGRTGGRGELRVRFGVDDVNDKYPYVVSMQYRYRKYCTGTLITPAWVLTCAHCYFCTHVRFGNMTTKRNEKDTRKIKKYIIHPRTRLVDIPEYIYHNDIALLLIEPIYMKNYGRISALNYRLLFGYPVDYAGFGLTWIDTDKNLIEMYKEDKLRPLQLGEGVVIRCSEDNFNIPNICVAPKCSNKYQDTLGGDSGGPLFYDGMVVGTLRGGDEPPIGQYTPVSPYLDWIRDTVTQEKI